MQILVYLHVNKTNFHMKGFALGLTLKQRRKATRKSPIEIWASAKVEFLAKNLNLFRIVVTHLRGWRNLVFGANVHALILNYPVTNSSVSISTLFQLDYMPKTLHVISHNPQLAKQIEAGGSTNYRYVEKMYK